MLKPVPQTVLLHLTLPVLQTVLMLLPLMPPVMQNVLPPLMPPVMQNVLPPVLQTVLIPMMLHAWLRLTHHVFNLPPGQAQLRLT